jgi:hypothetical protein
MSASAGGGRDLSGTEAQNFDTAGHQAPRRHGYVPTHLAYKEFQRVRKVTVRWQTLMDRRPSAACLVDATSGEGPGRMAAFGPRIGNLLHRFRYLQ